MISRNFAFSVVIAIGLLGCSKKVPECNSVAAVVNKLSEDSKAVKETGDAKLKADAALDEKAMGDLAKLELTVPEVKKFNDDLQKNLKAEAEGLKALAALPGDADPAGMAEPIKKAGEAHNATVAEMNKFSSGS